MRDEHRPKQELIHEITGLRKQVVDLKEAMATRRRVEDALRSAEALLRALSDGAPVGLGLFRPDGTLLMANQRLARMLGYDSPADLQSHSAVFGVFATPDEQSRALGAVRTPEAAIGQALFRRKDGCRRTHAVLAGESPEGESVTLAVFEGAADHFRPPFPANTA